MAALRALQSGAWPEKFGGFFQGEQLQLCWDCEVIPSILPQTVHCWGSILEKKELATLTGRAPELCGWALCPGLVLLLSSVAAVCPGLVLLLAAP